MGITNEEETQYQLSNILQELSLNSVEEDLRLLGQRSAELNLDDIEEIFGYKFVNKGLLQEALTHPSYNKHSKDGLSYERLEYMGDSILNMLIAKELIFLYPDLPPGPLTRLRAVNVDNEKLARVAVNLGLDRYLRHKAPHLIVQIREFKKAILDYPVHSNGLIEAPKFLADIVESSIGAVFIDSNCSTDIVWKTFQELLKPMIDLKTIGNHPVTELQELCQKRGHQLKFMKDLWKENTTVDVFIDGQLMGSATYGAKKEIAQNRAAKNALEKLKGIPEQHDLKSKVLKHKQRRRKGKKVILGEKGMRNQPDLKPREIYTSSQVEVAL